MKNYKGISMADDEVESINGTGDKCKLGVSDGKLEVFVRRRKNERIKLFLRVFNFH